MLYLASASPRRAELLQQIAVQYQVMPAHINEDRLDGESPADYVCRIAATKARKVGSDLGDQLQGHHVLAADTTVTIDGDIIGKPVDRSDCCAILKRLSGRTQTVLTAVSLLDAAGVDHRLSQSRVRFRSLSSQEIEAYCQLAEPMDKAGAYAIQGRAAIFVEDLQGSYSGVMGLPLLETAELLKNANIRILE